MNYQCSLETKKVSYIYVDILLSWGVHDKSRKCRDYMWDATTIADKKNIIVQMLSAQAGDTQNSGKCWLT